MMALKASLEKYFLRKIDQVRFVVLCLPVLGHNALTEIPSSLNSCAMPRTHMDMPYLAIV